MATDIVQSLFGVTPQAYQQAQQDRMDAQALQYAKLDPFQQANYAIGRGANMLGGAIGGALGGQDPELQRITMRQQIAGQLDPNDLSTFDRGIEMMRQGGDGQGALMLQMERDKAQQLALTRGDEALVRSDLARKRAAEAAMLKRQQEAQAIAQGAYVPPVPEQQQFVEVDAQGQPITIPARPAAINPQLVASELFKTAEGRAELKNLLDVQKSIRPETFDLAEGTKRYGYDAAGNVIKIAGVDKEKPQPTFGSEAERIAKAEYGKRYGDLTPAESLIVNKKVDAVELLKVPKIVVDVKDPTAVAKASLDTMNKWEGFLKSSGDVELANRYSNLQSSIELARKGNPNADGASLYNLAKIYDPSGAVQEGDKKSILGNASIPDRVKLLAQQFYIGGSFTPQQRTNMLAIAKEIRDQRNTQIERYRKEYVNVITKFGGSPESIFNPYSINQQPANLSSVINAPPSK